MKTDPRIIDILNSPQDLKTLSVAELEIVAQELREEIVRVTSLSGGHVASSLGTVEIIIALHSMLTCPDDKIVFDVGHQAYAHKLLTGRLQEFSSLRTHGGISGFPKPSESPFDVHPSGHASDSLSVAMGLAKARELNGSQERIVAVIGDASISGGMAFEALNHIGHAQIPMVIILNDNEMSISRNVGALMKHLGYLRTKAEYRNTRDGVQDMLENTGKAGQVLANFSRNVKESVKQIIIPQSVIFESLGIVCTAPIDGHDIAALQETLQNVLDTEGPVLVHVVTKKGAGFDPAEKSPEVFHGVGPYNMYTGEVDKTKSKIPTYTQVFSQTLISEAEQNEDIVAITAAMQAGTGLNAFAEAFPNRFIDVGIAEAHATGLASGLAIRGKKPVVALYSTFMQRAIDQLIINNALSSLDVVFALDRAGLVGDDGPTHHGVFDLVYTRMIPNMKVLAPSNEAELQGALHTALHEGGPFAIRYPRGPGQGVSLLETPQLFEVGKSVIRREGNDVCLLAFGRMVGVALDAAEYLEKQNIEARVVDMRWAKPLDTDAIKEAAKTKLLVTLEEGVLSGGVGEGVLAELACVPTCPPVLLRGIPDFFVGQGKTEQLFKDLEIDGKSIANAILNKLGLPSRV
jgi:1-deoxy-D-xylulose-5-phosphate synthase